MKISNKLIPAAVLVVAITFGLAGSASAATSPTLGAVGSYSVLGHTTVTNTGATTMPGDLGISIGGSPTGFPPGTVGPSGTIRNAGDSLAAQNANTAAFLALSAAPNAACDGANNYGAITKDLVGLTLTPGVYCADAFALTGTLNLDAEGNPDAVWIFRSELSTLVTSTGDSVATVRFVNGIGSSCNVWWKVSSSATLGTGTDFIGNILAYASITIANGVRLDGRALAQTGAVTLDDDTITGGSCLASAVYQSTTDTGNSTGTTTVPGLPNTGVSSTNSKNLMNMLILAGIFVASLLLTVSFRKREI